MSYTLASSLQKPSLLNFPLHRRSEFKHTPISPFARNSTFFLKPLYPLRVRAVAASVRCYSADNDDVNNNRPKIQSTNLKVAKPIVHAVFCVVFGFFCPFCRTPVFAAPLPAFVRKLIPAEKKEKGHKYTGHTRRLLEVASRLLKIIEGGKNAGKVDMAANVEEGLKEVKEAKKALEEEIMNDLYTELRGLKGEKEDLVARSEEIMEKVLESKREEDSLMRKTEGGDRIDKLREGRRILEKEYNDISERIEDIEDLIERKETLAVSIGVTELFLVERECEALAKSFLREISGPKNACTSVSPVAKLSKLSKDEFQKELQDAHRLFLEQIILSNVLVSGDKDSLCSQDSDSTAFALRIEQILRDSRKLQKNLEAQIRKTMRKHDEERHFIDSTLPYDVIKGYPDIELKWMFGKKEVTFPRGMINTLLHGWKKWREDVKMDLKRSFFEDSELGKNYMAERQEHVLRDRDRVASRTWYNEQRKRWELDPVAVPYAVSRKLVESARIRHDLAAMYITLKGNDKEYYVDVNEFEMAFEEFGGFDALYLRLLAANIPTAVQLMWIPFPELNFRQQFLLILTLCHQCFSDFWNNTNVSIVKQWALKEFRNTNDDIMMIVFPVMESVIESVISYECKLFLGMGPAFCYEPWGSTLYLKWKSEVSLRSRGKDKNVVWYIWFLVRTAIYGYVVFHVIPFMIRFMKRRVPRALGLGPLRRDPNLRKLRRVKAYLKYRINIIKRKRRSGGFDPISTAFDHMKRIKNPPIPLKDFASVESMREEINEVVAFLQNPRAFQEMGARAPRGVLIVGEIGTGKTSLAMAIAAEAKVPLVEVKAQQLEAGQFVGQGASNVRELFQAARDLAPVIIFVEDFDLFAGVRGKDLHTKKLDHESFINQLLVELDGFEKQDGVVLMATTRNLKQIDGALLRPGRMDRIFHLQRLTQAERRKILLLAAKESMDEELIDFVDWQKVAEKTALLRPIELKSVPLSLEGSAFRRKFVDTDELMSYCSWFATFSAVVPKWVRKTKTSKKISKMLVNHLGLTLTKDDVQYVVDFMEPYGQISNGIEMLSPPLDWSREAKFPHAVWAAGRGLMALILPNFDVVDSLWLEPSSWEGIGFTKITKARNEGSMKGNVETRAYLEKKLVFCFGSYVASQLLLPFGEENVLSTLELKDAQEIATRMVMHYAWGPDDSPTIYHHGKTDRALSMGDNFEHEMAAKVEKIYNFAYDKAKMLLQKNYLVLEKIVEELLEYEVLTGKDLERIVAENGGIREKEPFLLSYGSYEEPAFRSKRNANAPTIVVLNTTN